MANKSYIGVNSVARNIKSMYVGVDGVARRVKSAYVGVNGVARQFFNSAGIHFVGRNNGKGTTVTSKDGNSLYISASRTTTGSELIDAYYELVDGSGNRYAIPAGSTITFTIRSSICESYSSYNCFTYLRLEDMSGNFTYPYKNTTLTDMTYTISKDSYLIFLCEVGYASTSDYARLWIDSFALNGEKIV